MQTRTLGNSDLKITPVGYGAWAIGGGGWQFAWGAQDDNDSIAAIHRALELGVNWIDTAAVYGLGHSEQVVARALKSWPGVRPYVFTKCGLRWDRRGQVQKVLRKESIRAEVEDSLQRLGVEVIDLYQIHWPPDPDSPELEEGWGTIREMQREGKVRWIGVSNFSVQQLRRANAIAPVTSLLRARRHRRDCLFSDGFRPANWVHDAPAHSEPAERRLAQRTSRFHGTQSFPASCAG